MDILGISRTVFQPFDGLSALAESGDSTYVLTPGASVDHMDFGIGAGIAGDVPTYILTPGASASISHSVSAAATYVMTATDGAIGIFEVEAGSTYIFTPDAASIVDRVAGVGIGDDVPTYVLTPEAIAGVDHLVEADSTYIFTPDTSEQHIENGVVPVTYIFTPEATTTGDFLVAPASTYIFTPEATGAVPEPHREAHADYIFEVACSAVVVAFTCMPLGRFRRGDVVPVALDLPFIPDRSPFAAVLDADDRVVQVFSMSRSDAGPGDFSSGLFVGQGYRPGHYAVVFTVLAGGIQQVQLDQCFDVIGGGDAAGPVISLACYRRGKVQAVLAHTGSGELVLGRNPSLDLTPPSSLPPGWRYAAAHPPP